MAEVGAATPIVVQRRYVFGPGVDEPLVMYEGADTTKKYWLVADERGSVVAVTGDAGFSATNTYDEYGRPGPGNFGLFQYTGQAYIAATGLYDYKARVYDPTLGRFLQTDPIGYRDGMNLYAYVGNDPVNSADPSGLATRCQYCKPYNPGELPPNFEVTVGGDDVTVTSRPYSPVDLRSDPIAFGQQLDLAGLGNRGSTGGGGGGAAGGTTSSNPRKPKVKRPDRLPPTDCADQAALRQMGGFIQLAGVGTGAIGGVILQIGAIPQPGSPALIAGGGAIVVSGVILSGLGTAINASSGFVTCTS